MGIAQAMIAQNSSCNACRTINPPCNTLIQGSGVKIASRFMAGAAFLMAVTYEGIPSSPAHILII